MHWEIIRLAIQYTNLIQNVPTDSSRPSFFSFVYKKTIVIMVLTMLYCVHCTPCMIVDQQIQMYKYNFSVTQMQIQMYKYCVHCTPCMIVDQPTLNLQMSILLSLGLWPKTSVLLIIDFCFSLKSVHLIWNETHYFFFSNYVATSSPVVAFDKEQPNIHLPLSAVGFNL